MNQFRVKKSQNKFSESSLFLEHGLKKSLFLFTDELLFRSTNALFENVPLFLGTEN